MDAGDVIWVPSEGANPSLQQLMSGGVDMVCCSLPEARTLLEADQVRALGVMAPQRAVGFEDVAAFPEQGNSWTLGGWRGLAVPLGTPQTVVDRLVETMERIVSREAEKGSFAEFMQSQKFDNTWRSPAEFTAFLKDTDDKLGQLLNSPAMQSVSQDSFDPMAYPTMLFCLLAVSLIGLVVSQKLSGQQRSIEKSPDAVDQEEDDSSPVMRVDNFLFVIASIVLYTLLAEIAGFVITASLILVGLLLKMGTRPDSKLVDHADRCSVYLFVLCLRSASSSASRLVRIKE